MAEAWKVCAPSSTNTIVQDVEQYLCGKDLLGTDKFEYYDDALRAVWPSLCISDPYAALFLAINVYLECAEKMGFEVKPSFLKEARKDNYL